jgi:hypothetical protein
MAMPSQVETRSEAIRVSSIPSVIVDAVSFRRGLWLAVGIIIALVLYLCPLYGGKSGMQLSEDLFNSLSKGSIHFIPGLSAEAQRYAGRPLQVSLEVDNNTQGRVLGELLASAGAAVVVDDTAVWVDGDLGSLALQALTDADALFANRGHEVEDRYGGTAKEVMYLWWSALKQVEERYLRSNAVDEASFLASVLTKAVEPAYNYYGVSPERVAERRGVVVVLLGLYVVFALWWGFAIYFLLQGLGITGAKASQG